MITLEERLQLLEKLRSHLEDVEAWQDAKEKAYAENGWFLPAFIELAVSNISNLLLQPGSLRRWVENYGIPSFLQHPKIIGIVTAGNIPLVGFHDFLCGFVSGHKLLIKTSSKDNALITYIVNKLSEWNAGVNEQVVFAERLTGCDAYIATGSNNTGRYFEYYFRNYPSIIRKNRTSVAVLNGSESQPDLQGLSDDMLQYFGFGCRNVSKLYVPEGYDFIPLLGALDKYKWMEDVSKFKNNYDYNLSLHILNNQYYMTNGTLLLVENKSIFSPISQVNFEYYQPGFTPAIPIENNEIQCIIGGGNLPFGSAQSPSLTDYADGEDTMKFLAGLG
jgi:hypothetical protein